MTSLLSLITPTNLAEERERFLASKSYNPTFSYIWQDEVVDLDFTSPLKRALVKAVMEQDHNQIVDKSGDLFEVKIDDDRMQIATKHAQEKGELSMGSAKKTAQLFAQAFEEFDIDYQVEIVPSAGFNVRPQHAAHKLLISEHIHFEFFSMEAEVHHELVHVIRYLNGKNNNIRHSTNFLPTEEGLASWCQDATNNDMSRAQHAIEYIASEVGLKGSLRDIYNLMMRYGMSSELAWKRASRHKFGFVDTSRPGDILKPAMYYANAAKIDKLTSDERLRLFVGKISLKKLTEHPKYQGVWSPQMLQEYFKL